MEEASRYTVPPLCSLFFLGEVGSFFFFYSFWPEWGNCHHWRGSDWDCVSEVNRLAVLDPLRVILADVFGFLCKDLGVDEEVIDDLLERTIQKVLEEGEEAGTI